MSYTHQPDTVERNFSREGIEEMMKMVIEITNGLEPYVSLGGLQIG
jgi:hypothetical protein